MKKIIYSVCTAMLFATAVSAQVPQAINYQAAVRDGSGAPLASSLVQVRFTVHDLTATGANVFQETNTVTTTAQGILNTTIGSGTAVTGSLYGIKWYSGAKFLEVELNTGAGYTSIGTQQMVSVPYAQLANGVLASNAGGNGLQAADTTDLFWGLNEGSFYRGYIGSYAGKNDDVDFGTGATNAKGSVHLTIQAVPKLTVDSIGRVGIGTKFPQSQLQTKGARGTSRSNVLITETFSTNFPGIMLQNDGSSTTGVVLYGRVGGGLNVVDIAAAAGYTPVYASAFTVASDRTMKKEIQDITTAHYASYMQQIRNIESATYRYNWEDENTRKYPHVGFISQSLPNTVTMEMDRNPSKADGETILGYNLSDMAGLSIIGLKALDAQLSAQQALIEKLEKRIAELENK